MGSRLAVGLETSVNGKGCSSSGAAARRRRLSMEKAVSKRTARSVPRPSIEKAVSKRTASLVPGRPLTPIHKKVA